MQKLLFSNRLFTIAITLGAITWAAGLMAAGHSASSIFVDDSIWDSAQLNFVPHTGSGAFGSYVTMNIPQGPVVKTCKAIEKAIGKKLINRGEAHITVVTPPEYNKILKPFLTMERINQIAEQNLIQNSSFDILCIGSGQSQLNGKKEETFFFVVQSTDLLKLRREVSRAFEAAGGEKGLFDAEKFYPHITIGFTKRDLHLSDGVVKNETSYDKRFRILIGI